MAIDTPPPMDLAPDRPRRRPDLTPMIDVVFLLLVFFMLATRFGTETALPLVTGSGGSGAQWDGPLRLIDVGPGGTVALNGSTLPRGDLADQLRMLMQGPDDPILLRARDASTQDLVSVMEYLRAAGLARLVLVN
ncbi:ExbD/TolR family protein [Phaeovulum vinaykumarii]|uniref:Biopolymer transport protein ExbD n=1 Tax=Phaeovulum vinaykumarii TaxID=407234 RepID=A0A1N7JLH4_9RHOB|nr:biopolymer transporter ExbD [Phaeovulum vinaykumarii]SIS50160.1 biopolymer transport protein ExbD [Phaeovulum vinaykumarii]SOB90128.1 biopolymer transport protein ExbD [Phaeovulum vinaykumarii]